MDNFEAPGLAEVILNIWQQPGPNANFRELLEWYRKLSPGYLVCGEIEYQVQFIIQGEYHKLHPKLKEEIREIILYRIERAERLKVWAKVL